MAEKGNLLDLLRKTLELAMPDMRHYYRVVKKARVVASYASDGRYYADVQPLRNDGTEDESPWCRKWKSRCCGPGRNAGGSARRW